MVEICKDAEAKELYFTTPLALGTKRRWPKTEKDDNKLRKTQPPREAMPKAKARAKEATRKVAKARARSRETNGSGRVQTAVNYVSHGTTGRSAMALVVDSTPAG